VRVTGQVSVSGCVEVRASDRVGFTSFDGSTPIAARFDADQLHRQTSVRFAPASTAEPFRTLTLPYNFALAAAYLPDTSC